MKVWLYRVIILFVALAGGSYAFNFVLEALSYESTDNAYIAGTIVPVSAEITGRVVKLHIEDNQRVSAGEILVEINQDDYLKILEEKRDAILRLKAEKKEIEAQIREKHKVLERALANREVVRAEELLARKEEKRYEKLFIQKAVSQSQYDNIQVQWKVVQARSEAVQAAVDEAEVAIMVSEARLKTQTLRIEEAENSRQLAELDVERTLLRAPVPGRVAKKNVDTGKYVHAGQALLAIVKDETWVVANFKETQIRKMTTGQPVELKIDAYPHIKLNGRIESIQPGTGSVFSLLPPENATGNFIKVVQRVPVKIVFDAKKFGDILKPGLSVVAKVDVSGSEASAATMMKLP
ncbi:MAG: HlyD family secretion protein [Syntrophales bacterium]|jgi:membrane fusion protein (multidrug efflux system)|nr:HlyD family secretion protein [Syntrophales bacterium]MDY0043886.1 HlyD family secretion protein [Syntrophales bacterium]